MRRTTNKRGKTAPAPPKRTRFALKIIKVASLLIATFSVFFHLVAIQLTATTIHVTLRSLTVWVKLQNPLLAVASLSIFCFEVFLNRNFVLIFLSEFSTKTDARPANDSINTDTKILGLNLIREFSLE